MSPAQRRRNPPRGLIAPRGQARLHEIAPRSGLPVRARGKERVANGAAAPRGERVAAFHQGVHGSELLVSCRLVDIFLKVAKGFACVLNLVFQCEVVAFHPGENL